MVLNEDIRNVIADKNIDWDKLRNSTVLITGATGLIGSLCIHVIKALDFPVNVLAMVRDETKAKMIFGNNVNYIIGDILKPINSNVNPDFVIHCAANTKSKMMIETPVDTINIMFSGTNNILEYAKNRSIKSMVYVSSMEAYGITDELQNPVTEDKLGYVDLKSARSSYSEGKRAAECLCSAYCHQYHVPVKIARLALTMGAGIPLKDNRVSMQFANSAILGKDIVLHTEGKSLSNFCYTSDCLRGLFTILLNGKDGEIYNVCNDAETRSIREVAELVAEEIADNRISVVLDIPKENDYGYAPDVVLRLSSEKLRKLGWDPEVNLESAYRRLIQYIKES